MHLFGCYYHIYRKNSNWTLVSGAACLQVFKCQEFLPFSLDVDWIYNLRISLYFTNLDGESVALNDIWIKLTSLSSNFKIISLASILYNLNPIEIAFPILSICNIISETELYFAYVWKTIHKQKVINTDLSSWLLEATLTLSGAQLKPFI